MYIPKSFKVEDRETLTAFIRANNFATLVTTGVDGIIASHIPLMYDPAIGEWGQLSGHLALANPQAQHLRADSDMLVIFQGPHAYVTPTWYEAPLNVPTWNYTAVHGYGRPSVIEDTVELRAMLDRLVSQHEQARSPEWDMSVLTEDYMHKMMGGIVAFEITLTRLEGKFKLSQNRSETDHATVAEHLSKSADATEHETGILMRTRPPTRK